MKKIKNIIPLGFPWKTQDPFLFCAYHRDEYPAGNAQMGPDEKLLRARNIGQDFSPSQDWRMYHGSTIPGFPFHPHRGFETITINKEGVVDHSDSLGAAGRFMAGDVQWMTAGKGVQHSEMFPLVNENGANPLEIFQIWLNLPKASKMVEAHFKMLWNEDIPILQHHDRSGASTEVQIVAGKLGEIRALKSTPDSWAANPENAVGVFTVKMEAGAEWILPKTNPKATRSIFFYKGESLQVENAQVTVQSIIEAEAGEDILLKNGSADAYLLILEGKPIDEPVVQYGPFVMNTEQEIRDAFQEYQRTQFGGWPWTEKEVVHNRNKGRFALHSDGQEELP